MDHFASTTVSSHDADDAQGTLSEVSLQLERQVEPCCAVAIPAESTAVAPLTPLAWPKLRAQQVRVRKLAPSLARCFVGLH